MAPLSDDRTSRLEQIINNSKNNSELNLSFKGFTDQDIENVIFLGIRNSNVSVYIYKYMFSMCYKLYRSRIYSCPVHHIDIFFH